MEVFLFTYEMYWMEIVGVLMVAVLALEIVLLSMLCVLRKRLRQMGDRLHLKNEMENSRRRDLKWGTRTIGQYGLRSEAGYSVEGWQMGNQIGGDMAGSKIMETGEKVSINSPEDNFDGMNVEKGEREYGQAKKKYAGELGQVDAAGERELILDVLGEIFP